MNWLITGGCGFCGVNLIRSLQDQPDSRIIVVDNLSTGAREDLAALCDCDDISAHDVQDIGPASGAFQVFFVEGDILDAELAIKASAGADVIVHFAANTGVGPSVADPRRDMKANVIGTFNYLEAARANQVRRFIFASSAAPVGEATPPIHEELAPHPVSPYGASKLAGEGYCSAYAKTFGIETVALRFSNVYGCGSGHKSSVVAGFIRKALAGDVLEVHGDGLQSRDFLYVDDLIKAVRVSATTPNIGGETFQIATGTETTLCQMLDVLLAALNEAGIASPEITFCERRRGDVRRSFCDTAKAGRMLNWKAAVALPEGLRRTVNWFVSQQPPCQQRRSHDPKIR